MNEAAWIGVYGFGLMLGMVAINVPVGFAMGLSGLVGLYWLIGLSGAMNALGVVASGEFVKYGLAVVPLFVMMGAAASGSGMSQGLYRLANASMGHRPGGLAMATIGSSAMFGAVCGSSLATAATMAKVAMPEMRRHKYDDAFAAGSVAAGGSLGILIPPSIIMIVYALITETPLFALFVAAVIPGLLAVASYLVVIRILVWRNPAKGPPSVRATWREQGREAVSALPVLALFTIVLGGIYGGVFTPTEAAAIGAVGGMAYLVYAVRGRFAPVSTVLLETVSTTAMIFIIVIGAGIFSFFLSFSGLPRVFAGAIQALDLPPFVILLVIMLMYLILGCFMESLGMMILTVPILFPLIQSLAPQLGMTAAESAIWFGIFVVVVVEIGLLTPPLGLNVFVMKGAISDISLLTIYRGVLPFWMMDILRLLALMFFPAIVLYLPRLMN